MMITTQLLYALFMGLGITWLTCLALGTRGPWNSYFLFFMVIFLFTWGGGMWITPFGPTGWGVAWMPFFFMAIIIALLISATTPHFARRRRGYKKKSIAVAEDKEKAIVLENAEIVVDIFFWLLISALGLVILGHYIRPSMLVF